MSLILFLCILFINVRLMIYLRNNFSFSKMNWLFSVYWFLNIIIGILFFNTSVDWKYDGLIVLIIYVDIFVVNYTLITGKYSNQSFGIEVWENKTQFVGMVLIACFVTGMVYMALELFNNGFNLSNLLSIKGLMESGYYFTDGRYGGRTEIKVSLIEQICLTINYSGFVLAGYAFKLNLVKKRYCFIQFFPMILSMLATTAKTTLISGIFLWITGYLVASNCRNAETSKIKIPYIKIGILILMVMVLFYISFYIRYGEGNSQNIFDRIIMYILGHIPCYDDWFSKFKINLFGYSHGQQTFMFFFGSKMPRKLANVYISPRFITKYSWTNVITLFAYVLMDFGIIGGMIFFGVFGAVAGWAISFLKSKGGAIAHGMTGMCYYIILYSFLVSPMRYLSIVGAYFLFSCYVFCLLRI